MLRVQASICSSSVHAHRSDRAMLVREREETKGGCVGVDPGTDSTRLRRRVVGGRRIPERWTLPPGPPLALHPGCAWWRVGKRVAAHVKMLHRTRLDTTRNKFSHLPAILLGQIVCDCFLGFLFMLLFFFFCQLKESGETLLSRRKSDVVRQCMEENMSKFGKVDHYLRCF